MIDVSVSTLVDGSKELSKQRAVLIEQCDRITEVLTEMSNYTDFDDQMKKLYELKKKLENDAYSVFCLGRVLELCSDCYNKTENIVIELSENVNMVRKKNTVIEQNHSLNPEYIVII